MIGEPAKGLVAALDRAEGNEAVAIGGAGGDQPERYLCAPACRLERNDGAKMEGAIGIEMVVGNVLGPADIAIDNLVLVIGAVRPVHCETPFAADPKLHSMNSSGEAVRAPPFANIVR